MPVAVRRLVGIVDDQHSPTGLTHQSLDRVPTNTSAITRRRCRPATTRSARRDWGLARNAFGRVSGNELYTKGRLVTPQQAANVKLQVFSRVPLLCLDDRRRRIAIDNVNNGQVTVALLRKASTPN